MHISIYYLVIGVFCLVIGRFFNHKESLLFLTKYSEFDILIKHKIVRIRYYVLGNLLIVGSVVVYFYFKMTFLFLVMVMILPDLIIKVYLKKINEAIK